MNVKAMSPASRSKSKDKKSTKETAKGSSKPSVHGNSNGGIPASGYNPLSGTFHILDDSDDGNLSVAGFEYDVFSNNGSWSGESEDQKEKASQPSRQESVPGADNDKREKIRQKNERKHQRQKERRAQELHERCSGYLMSRKLEALSQQLVVMGFSQERATMALILNEGKVEESVAWLFEGGEEDKRFERNVSREENLKIDISEELGRMNEMEVKYKASKQEVERVVISCDGDLDKAEDMLKAQKDVPPKSEETGDPDPPTSTTTTPANANGKTSQIAATRVQVQAQAQAAKGVLSDNIQLKRGEREFNYTKLPTMVWPTTTQKIPPKSEWAKTQQVPVEKSWPTRAPPEAVGNELKKLQLGSVREPVTVMQRPQSSNAKQPPVSSVATFSPPGTAMGGWYNNNNGDSMKGPGPGPNLDVSSNPLYNQYHYNNQSQPPKSSRSMDSQVPHWGNGLWGRGGGSQTQTLSAASSLGLFSGLGGNGSSSSAVDWDTGTSMLHMDYTSIDWSLDLGSLQSRPGGMWAGPGHGGLQSNGGGYDSFGYGLGVRKNGNGGVIQGGSGETSGGVSREWSSPFEEKDIFSLPRQFVLSPSL